MVTSTTAASAFDDAKEQASITIDKLRDQTDAAVQRMRPQFDAVTTYARDEPTKALLISAATGAALMAVVALMSRSSSVRLPDARDVRQAGRNVRDSGNSILAALRDAALDFADRTQSAAGDALGSAQKYVETQQTRVSETADSAAGKVGETVSDAWKSLRDQAVQGIDKIRPQIDAAAGYAKGAASYAKEDPARVALGVAAIGAVLIGLLSLVRSSQRD